MLKASSIIRNCPQGCLQRSGIAEVQEIEFRQARQLKPNLYLKVDDLHLAK